QERESETGSIAESVVPSENLPILPPQLISANVAEITRTQEDAGGGLIVLRLTISEEGRVTDAEIDQGLVVGLDEQVRQAAFNFEFTPAMRGDSPVSVT